jgi:hypothetical protein
MKGKLILSVTVGTNDLNRAKQFYDTLLGELGAVSLPATKRFCRWQEKTLLQALPIEYRKIALLYLSRWFQLLRIQSIYLSLLLP